MIRAALELVHLTYLLGSPADPEAVRALEDALLKLGPENGHLQAWALAGLAHTLAFAGEPDKQKMYANQAVAMARSLDDPDLLSYALLGVFLSLMAPDDAEQRLEIATEKLDLAKKANSTDRLVDAFFWRAFCLYELGSVVEADKEIASWSLVAQELRHSLHLSLVMTVRAMRASMSGRLDEGERLAQEAMATARGLQTENSAGIFGLQMFALRREQGRLKELEGAIRFFVQQQTLAGTWRPGLAVIYSELGHKAEARDLFEALAQHDFVDLPRDALWMGTLTYLVDVCTYLEDEVRADLLYRILLPFDGRNVVISTAVACYGAISRYLGALATTLRRWGDAERHFEDATATNTRMGAVPWLAHTQHQYGKMLLARNRTGDRDKAVALLDQ